MRTWEEKLMIPRNREYLLEECQFGTKEDQRTGESALVQSVYGLQGTFKQLEFD